MAPKLSRPRVARLAAVAFLLGSFSPSLSRVEAQGLPRPGGFSRNTPRVQGEVSLSPSSAGPGQGVKLQIDLEIQKGWYIYSPDFEGTGKPTRVRIQGNLLEPAGELHFPEPKIKHIPILNETHRYLDGKPRFRQTLKVATKASPGDHPISVKIDYQACTENICEQPSTIELSTSLEVTAAKGPGPLVPLEPAADSRAPPYPPPSPQKPPAGGLGKAPRIEGNVSDEPPLEIPPEVHGESVSKGTTFPTEGLFILICAVLAVIAGLYLLGLIPLKSRKNKAGPLQLFIAILAIIFGTYCIHGARGNRMDRIMQAIIPIYEMVDPGSKKGEERRLGTFLGADLRGKRFLEFLKGSRD